jgi:hypothetical protein
MSQIISPENLFYKISEFLFLFNHMHEFLHFYLFIFPGVYMTPHTTITKPNLAPWNNTPSNNTYRNPIKPIKSIQNQEFKERRLKGMCFWCDEKFVSRHKC